MIDRRIAWIALGATAFVAPIVSEGCASDTTANNNNGGGVCGNGIMEAGESCDDGNTNDADGCRSDCTSSTCGDGMVQEENGEDCDDGDTNDENACNNSCQPNANYCGNGVTDGNEECDDGNTITDDDCTNACTDPICGDGIVQQGEFCDDGNGSEFDDCPSDCMDPEGPNPCEDQAIYKGYVNNDTNPAMTNGAGIPSRWSYGGFLGVNAGNEMCAAIGADHVCSWEEIVAADAAGELDGSNGGMALPEGTEFWVHRLGPVARLTDPNIMSDPGAGARCNDWTYPTNHISDGEFGKYDTVNPANTHNNARKYGNVFLFIDDDAGYEPQEDGTANPPGCEGTGPLGGCDHECDSSPANAAAAGVAGCAGACGTATPKAILCCFPTCE